MTNTIRIGDTFTWTLKSPRITALSSEEFDAFVEAYLEYMDEDAFSQIKIGRITFE